MALDHLRQGIGLRAYGQKDPLNEYKREAFDMFEDMLDNLRETVTSVMCHLELSVDAEELAAMERAQAEIDVQETRMDPAFADKEMALARQRRTTPCSANADSKCIDQSTVGGYRPRRCSTRLGAKHRA